MSIIMLSVTRDGEPFYDFGWDNDNKILSTTKDHLVISCNENGITYNTGSFCTFKVGNYCKFTTGSHCTFLSGYMCEFMCDENCVGIRFDVKGIIEIPKSIPIRYNGCGISGYVNNERKAMTFDITDYEYVALSQALFQIRHGIKQ